MLDIETAEKLVGKVVAFEVFGNNLTPFLVHDVVQSWECIRVWAYTHLAEFKLSDIVAYTVYEPGERIECK